MSGINGTGIFYSIMVFFSLYIYETENLKKYLYTAYFFVLIIILTGSFTGLGSLVVFLLFKYRNSLKTLIKPKILFKLLTSLILFISLTYSIKPLNSFVANIVEKRMEKQFIQNRSPHWYIPNSLYGRAVRWSAQLSILKDKPFFGYGTNIPEDEITALITESNPTANPHNYYVHILMQGGIIGFLGYLYFVIFILKLGFRIKILKSQKILLLSVIVVGLISQISSLTFQYGGYSELFGIMMAILFYFKKYDLMLRNYVK
jgi:O-antigen ligase